LKTFYKTIKSSGGLFPILGGRLLKRPRSFICGSVRQVSNPWREAIEERRILCLYIIPMVSNPWREAIEDVGLKFFKTCTGRFQSLEGGY